jgi:hypothetical protein
MFVCTTGCRESWESYERQNSGFTFPEGFGNGEIECRFSLIRNVGSLSTSFLRNLHPCHRSKCLRISFVSRDAPILLQFHASDECIYSPPFFFPLDDLSSVLALDERNSSDFHPGPIGQFVRVANHATCFSFVWLSGSPFCVSVQGCIHTIHLVRAWISFRRWGLILCSLSIH